MASQRLDQIEAVMRKALDRAQLPGAVVLVVREGRIVYRKAFGRRSLQPAVSPMTVDTVFDLASLTKPLATAASVMILLEQGRVRLADRVAQHLPDFGKNGKERITVEQLLLHTSGLVADNPEADYADGPVKALERVFQLAPAAPPGSKFIYSDVGYIVLGELVRRLAGKGLDEFAAEHLFGPLGLRDTTFRPGPALAERAAPPRAAKAGGFAERYTTRAPISLAAWPGTPGFSPPPTTLRSTPRCFWTAAVAGDGKSSARPLSG